MLDFVIFAITFVVALLAAVFYLYPGSRRATTIPGLDPSDSKEGNLPDIRKAGSIHQFLKQLHEDHGDIAGFWFGERFTVSIASPDLFKEQLKVFNRPKMLFEGFKGLIGQHSIQLTNGMEGRQKRKEYDRYFSHESINACISSFTVIGNNLIAKWETMPKDQHIPLHQYMMALVLKTIIAIIFGSVFSDDKKIIEFMRLYEVIWTELESRQLGFSSDENVSQDKILQQAILKLHSMVTAIIEERKKSKSVDKYVFIDFLMDKCSSTEELQSDLITYIVGGFHTTGNLLTWMIYFLATHDDVQKQLHDEIIGIIGDADEVTIEDVNKMPYLNQVTKESLRLSLLAPFAARYQDIDVELGGHVIPKDTPVIHALSIVLQDEKYWPNPNRFDPDRFSAERFSELPHLCFSPFGFAGQRSCPGQKLFYAEAGVYISLICRKFKFSLVEGQVVKPVYGLVTRPQEEIWVALEAWP